MTDDVDKIRRDFETAVAAASAQAFDRLRALADASADRADDRHLRIKDLMPAAEAAALARVAKTTMATWCRKNQVFGDTGFAVRIGARWHVSRSRLIRHLAADRSKSTDASDKPAHVDALERFQDCASGAEVAMVAASD
jgi:hypothetical protein